MSYQLEFERQEDRDVFYRTLLDGLDTAGQKRAQAAALVRIGDYVNAYGPGRVPVIHYAGASTWMVSLVSTSNDSPGLRLVEQVYLFKTPASPDIARAVTTTIHDLVEDIKRLHGDDYLRLRRKLHHLCTVLDPNLEAMFGCIAERKVQEVILRRIEQRSELAAGDLTVSASSSLKTLSDLLGKFRSRRNLKNADSK